MALLALSLRAPDPRRAVRTSADCRAQAQAAAARGDYEIFHDLAWRAVQKGPRNDPDLMYLLARARRSAADTETPWSCSGGIADLGGRPTP